MIRDLIYREVIFKRIERIGVLQIIEFLLYNVLQPVWSNQSFDLFEGLLDLLFSLFSPLLSGTES